MLIIRMKERDVRGSMKFIQTAQTSISFSYRNLLKIKEGDIDGRGLWGRPHRHIVQSFDNEEASRDSLTSSAH